MTDQGRQFTTCPHCGHETDMPDGFIVAWVAHPCASCKVPSIHPKSFSEDEAAGILLDESVTPPRDV